MLRACVCVCIYLKVQISHDSSHFFLHSTQSCFPCLSSLFILFPSFCLAFFWASSTVLMNIIVESYFYVEKERRWKKHRVKGLYPSGTLFFSRIYIIAFIWIAGFSHKLECTFILWIFNVEITRFLVLKMVQFLARFIIFREKKMNSQRCTKCCVSLS